MGMGCIRVVADDSSGKTQRIIHRLLFIMRLILQGAY